MKKKVLSGLLSGYLLLAILTSCDHKPTSLFKALPSDDTGVHFNNLIRESDTFNILTHEYIYNGGGVGVGDFNNDGKQDLFFTGNVVPNKLFLNEGNLKFRDVSDAAGISKVKRWCSGVSIVDINKDGWVDIYVSATMLPDSSDRKNILLINKGLNEKGDVAFEDQAAQYHVDDMGYSVSSAFFDYDKDGDLDLYVLTNEHLRNVPTNYRPKITDGSSPNNDRLYRNNGDGSFTNVTLEAGITIEGFGLGLCVADVSMDGFPDIYVSNDFLSNDILYINNRDGTFTNRIAEFMGHQSQFSMGNDAADINNDGMPDIITVDMLPETNFRKKTTIGNKSYLSTINNEKYHYEYQYIRNMLHLNNGADRKIKFSEIGQLAGVYQTEWSWSPLLADFDNDGNKDLIVTNGFPKDITDKDFANYRSQVGNIASLALLKDSIPVVKIPNYAFRNRGDLTFADATREWGLETPSFSNGAAFADLDNDGDLDYIINNIDSDASVYENTLYDGPRKSNSTANSFLRIKLADPANKKSATGAKITLFQNHGLQFYENTIYRGFLSSVEDAIHFGLGNNTVVDSVIIEWSDGNVQKLVNPPANQLISVEYRSSGEEFTERASSKTTTPFFRRAEKETAIAYLHEEEDKIDFNLQRTIPHKFSQSGPGMAVGDINGDGLDDLVVGGSMNYAFAMFFQKPDGSFRSEEHPVRDLNKTEEDEGLLLFDADGDKDLDLYIVSGSIESYQTVDSYQDRLYTNNGKGKFTLDPTALPDTKSSGSCVRAADFDRDGDLDLFVGGRVVPGKYPMSPESYLLRNDHGKFTNATAELSPELKNCGMVTDALWTDFNNDQKIDLIVVGEFTPIMFFKNSGKDFARVKSGIDNHTGWWNSITSGDFDSDGDMDYVAGNLGLNNNYQVTHEFPLKVYAKDFDGNGSMDPVMACYMRESMSSDVRKLYPVHFWDELNSQSPKFRNKFSYYRQYGMATMQDLLTYEDMLGALKLEANEMASCYIENTGNGEFELVHLPTLAQIAPVNGLITKDVNDDGNADVIMVGNDYGNEVFAGRYDAFTGLILLGNGHGGFSAKGSAETGFYVPGDAKSLVSLIGTKNDLLIASQNRDSLKVFARATTENVNRFIPEALDVKADLMLEDGRKQLVEFHYGAGYLSQSARELILPKGVTDILVYDSQGHSRKEIRKPL